MKFERIVKFAMPFDERTDNPNTNYGIGAMRIWFILKGTKGAVQVMISTSFYLPSTINEYMKDGRDILKTLGKDSKPFECWDVGFHSKKKPEYMNKSQQQDCDILGKCYYDGSSLRGEQDGVAEMFFEKGENAIWEYLEKRYEEQFALSRICEEKKNEFKQKN